MPDFKDFVVLTQRLQGEAKAAHIHELRTQLPRIADITHKAQSVFDHAGWQLFADRIESRVQEIEKLRTAKTHAMIFGKAMGHDLELLKIELNTMDAEIAGLRYAAGLIPEAIQAGAELLRVAAGRADT